MFSLCKGFEWIADKNREGRKAGLLLLTQTGREEPRLCELLWEIQWSHEGDASQNLKVSLPFTKLSMGMKTHVYNSSTRKLRQEDHYSSRPAYVR